MICWLTWLTRLPVHRLMGCADRHYILAHETARRLAAAQCMSAPLGYHVRITEPLKKREQEEK